MVSSFVKVEDTNISWIQPIVEKTFNKSGHQLKIILLNSDKIEYQVKRSQNTAILTINKDRRNNDHVHLSVTSKKYAPIVIPKKMTIIAIIIIFILKLIGVVIVGITYFIVSRQNKNKRDSRYTLNIFDLIEYNLQISKNPKNITKKCWNCLKIRNYLIEFCANCGKSW